MASRVQRTVMVLSIMFLAASPATGAPMDVPIRIDTVTGNTAGGQDALLLNGASSNTAFGSFALLKNGEPIPPPEVPGGSNTASGAQALRENNVGGANTAIGVLAL